MDDYRCLQFTVSGRVQGVYFRASAQEQATALDVTGWIRNTSDGRVEGVACGASAAVDALVKWLHEGPPQAKVDDVAVKDIPAETFESFGVRYF